MDRYDYYRAVRDDIIDYINDNYSKEEIENKLLYDADEWQQELYDDMFVSDSVTGNASGSYTFNAWRAEEYVCHNLDLLGEAASEFGSDMDLLKNGAEACDVTIRCYLLGGELSGVIEDLKEQYGV